MRAMSTRGPVGRRPAGDGHRNNMYKHRPVVVIIIMVVIEMPKWISFQSKTYKILYYIWLTAFCARTRCYPPMRTVVPA